MWRSTALNVSWLKAALALGALALLLLIIEGQMSGNAPGNNFAWDCKRATWTGEFCLRRP